MKKFLALCAAAVMIAAASPAAEAASGRVMLVNDYYLVVQVEPSYLDRYTGARMYSFLPRGVRTGDRVDGIENTWGRQTWTIGGHELRVGVDEYDMDADEAMEYFSKHSR